jgi:hypothetical protein
VAGRGAGLPVDINGLNERDRVFVAAYATHFDGSRAIAEAFPDVIGKTSRASSAKLMLSRPEISAAVEEITSERRRRYAIDGDRVMRELAAVALSDIRDVVDWDSGGLTVRNADELAPEHAAAVKSIIETVDASGKRTLKVELHPKLPALEALGKHYKLWANETNVNLLVASLNAVSDEVLERRIAELQAKLQGEQAPILLEARPVEPAVISEDDIFG